MVLKQSPRGMSAIVFLLLIVGTFLLFGCSGDDGDTGPAGAQGPPGPPGTTAADLSTMTEEQQAELGTVRILESSITVNIQSPPVVTFSLIDAFGRPVLGLADIVGTDRTTGRIIRFTLAKLVPGTDPQPAHWKSYILDEDGTPTYDSPYGGGTLVANDDNTYTYTFATDVGSDPDFDPSATHRLAGQLGGGGTGFDPSNLVYDFVPDGSAVSVTRDIVMTASCNECHDPLNFHGRRRDVGYCVTCHNPDLAGGEGGMAFMTHKLHAAGTFTELDDGVSYAEVTYPQELQNCRKCHNGDDAETPQGNYWQTVQNRNVCFTQCHMIPESVPEFHENTSVVVCDSCHNAEDGIASVLDIAQIHATLNATANNPELLEGQRDIDYELVSAAVAGGNLEITFRVLSDGTSLDLTALPADLSGPGRWPGFLIAYAMAQDGINEPVDFNNLGNTAGQPQSVGLDDLADGTAGTLSCADGTCTATMADPFPAGAKMRTVGLQGYFQQDIDGDTVSLHTRSAVVTVDGDAPRRMIAGNMGCAACHEIFEGHGGNRVFTADGGVDICTLCHNPNLSSGGRSVDPADAVGSHAALALGTTDTLTWPEATNNLKDMIHGIHAADVRSSDYEFVRVRNDGIYYNWSEVTFPGDIANCVKCHVADTYLPEEVPGGALMTTERTTGVADGMDPTSAAVAIARDNLPNATDWVHTPISAACYACHDGLYAVTHMELNGGAVSIDAMDVWNRSDVDTVDTCGICHGSGNIADVEEAHNLFEPQ